MAKLEGLFSYEGTFRGVTMVDSRAYGKHIRKARTKFTLGKEMKQSSQILTVANIFAKVFQDAIDPYRRDFRDGKLWQRLVSLFKKLITKKGIADFWVLEDLELHKRHPLSRILATKVEAKTSDGSFNVLVTSRLSRDPTKGRADGWEQTLIVLFVDDALQVTSFSERTIIPLRADPGQQSVNWPIPENATSAILVLKCNFSKGGVPLDWVAGMGMRVEKVVWWGDEDEGESEDEKADAEQPRRHEDTKEGTS